MSDDVALPLFLVALMILGLFVSAAVVGHLVIPLWDAQLLALGVR